MLITLKEGITTEQKNNIRSILYKDGCIVRDLSETGQNIIGAVGRGNTDVEALKKLPGVEKVIPISTSFKLVSRELHPENTVVQVGDVAIGSDRIVIVAGPCAVESRDQCMIIAREVKKYGAVLFRGGAYKPRTSPYSFQGLEEEGLKILAEVREETGLRVATEITSPAHADLMMKYVDVLQIGARNMQNFELLKCVGRMGKPVILKRGLSATIKEWLMSAEYILSEGNEDVILCERGIRTFEPYTRNTLDLSAIPILKKLTHLPVLVDPSHATGIREKVAPMARAAVAAGADALMIEVHHDPDNALSDGPQSLYPRQFGQLARDLHVIAPVVDKQLDFNYLEKAAAIRNLARKNGTGKQKLAFLGEKGAFGHKAGVQYFGEQVAALPMPSWRAVFDAVRDGGVEFGVIPLENSLSGSIHENYEMLLDYDLVIVGEIMLRVKYHLIAHPGTNLNDIRKVLVPAPVVAQCRDFLDRNEGWERIPVNATASAVKYISGSDDQGIAAIGSLEAAEIHNMEIIEEGVESNPQNYTRFVIISRQPISDEPKSKTSIIFSTGNRPGALYEVLKVFSENSVNLVKLESRPIHGKPWEYMFYADLEVDACEKTFKPVLESIKEKTDFLKIIGVY
jgi:3-deoxy-7-phosphoheptulonate synthase